MNQKLCIILLIGLLAVTGYDNLKGTQNTHQNVNRVSEETENIEDRLTGTWKTEIEKDVDLQISYNKESGKLSATSLKWGYENYNIKAYTIENGRLAFDIPYKSGEQKYTLSLEDASITKLVGNYTISIDGVEIGDPVTVCFKRESDKEEIGELITNEFNFSLDERKKVLEEYKAYHQDAVNYTFEYEIGQETRDEAFIESYHLDELTQEKEDVALMETLLHWVCRECNHGNPPATPEKQDPAYVMAFGKAFGQMNCRELSLLLAGTLRMYGIEARHVACLPEMNVFNDCHVVVEAYSRKLEQWILLDPTFNLILQDGEGNYINLQTLRKAIIEGKELVPNEEFAYNEEETSLDNYINYMSKNCFRFECLEKLYPGVDKVVEGNRVINLVPVGYEKPIEANRIVITTDEERFFAPPAK